MNNGIGLLGEKVAYTFLRERWPSLYVRWLRREGKVNAPFDIEIWDRRNLLTCIEVKAFSPDRKWDWTQYKRPAIRRKKAYAQKNYCDRILTVVVGFRHGKNPEIRYAEGLPSQAFGKFKRFPK